MRCCPARQTLCPGCGPLPYGRSVRWGSREHTDVVVEALHDDDVAVCRAAERAVELLERRLDQRL